MSTSNINQRSYIQEKKAGAEKKVCLPYCRAEAVILQLGSYRGIMLVTILDLNPTVRRLPTSF
ncbi:MAG: hypothetical protein ACJ70O_03890 [Nitrososphaera sp.]